MGSHRTQGIGISVFLLSFVALGIAFAGGGLLFVVLFLLMLGAAGAILLKCKAMEGAAE